MAEGSLTRLVERNYLAFVYCSDGPNEYFPIAEGVSFSSRLALWSRAGKPPPSPNKEPRRIATTVASPFLPPAINGDIAWSWTTTNDPAGFVFAAKARPASSKCRLAAGKSSNDFAAFLSKDVDNKPVTFLLIEGGPLSTNGAARCVF
jgi:hypothetical protein